jgi:hypothetical protein
MKNVRLLCTALLFSSLCFAQQTPAASERPSRGDVLALMDTLHVRQMMAQMVDGMKAQGKKNAEAGFRYKLPNATPEQVAKATSLVDDVFSDINVDELIDVIIPIYQQHVSKSDLQQILAFYQSPVGQRLLAEQPAMMQESMAKSAELMQSKMPALMKRLDERMSREFPELADPPAPKTPKKPATSH